LATTVLTEDQVRARREMEARTGLGWAARRFIREWPLVPMTILIVILTFAAFADIISGYDPLKGVLTDRLIPPAWYAEGSTANLLGTDPLGRDIMTRIMHGARISLMVVGIVLSAGAIGGTVLGMISGWFGGLTDEIIQRFVEFTIAMPFILVALVVVIVLGHSLEVIIILLVVFSWNGFTRQVRGETLQLKNMDYIALAKIAGASTSRILARHILPGVINTVMVLVSLSVGTLIITESVLSYLGVGIPPPTPAWGVMVSDGRNYIVDASWVSFYPGLAILFTVLAFNFLGDWIRDRLDPRLRQLI
jgi:peptide/nickel transport system permease protein